MRVLPACWKRSKIFCWSALAMPMPLSLTSTRRKSASCQASSSIRPSVSGAEFHGVRDQVHDHLGEAIRIGPDWRKIGGDPGLERDVARLGEQAGGGGERLLDHRPWGEVRHMPLRRPRLHLGEVENIVDEPAQSLALLDDDTHELLALLLIEIGVVAQDFAERANRGQRGANLVAHRGDEIVLQLVELLEALVGGSKFGRRRLELARFLFELARIDHQLRGLVEDLQDLVDVVHLLAQHRCDHDAGGRGADGAGELTLRIGDDVGVGRTAVMKVPLALALETREGGVRAHLADEADEQLPEIADRRAAAPDARGFGRSLENVDELHRLAALDDRTAR